MLSIIIFFLAICFYATVANATMNYCRDRLGMKDSINVISPFGFFAGLFWPIFLTVHLMSNAPKVVAQGLKKTKNELIPGVPKPTDILIGLISQQILMGKGKFGYERWVGDTWEIEWNIPFRGKHFTEVRICRKSAPGKFIVVSDKSALTGLQKTINQRQAIDEEKEKAQKQAQIEHEAVLMIEDFLSPVETTKV